MLSIIIPTYNEEKVIGGMLAKLKSGLALPHEIIVTDDKSTDRTVEIARIHADKVLCPAAKHPTIAANRNAGAAAANGDFLAFIDADCIMADPQAFFERALADFRQYPKMVALTGIMRVLPEYETYSDRFVYFFFNLIRKYKNNLINAGESSGEFQMVRRERFEVVGGFRGDLVTREDADLFWRLSRIGQVRCDSELVVYNTGRRVHAIGWFRLLCIWILNTLWVTFFNRSWSKEWKPVR